jgi:hypothetical protein
LKIPVTHVGARLPLLSCQAAPVLVGNLRKFLNSFSIKIASSKILPRFQNLRTNVNISVTLQGSSLEKLEKLSSFTYLPSTYQSSN